MHTSLLNTAALWYCLCCLDLVLFCGIVELIFLLFFLNSFISFCACVSGSMLYLEMNGMPGWVLGDIFFGLYRFSGVCPSGWGHTSICHSCHSHPPHACQCEEWAALSPLLFSEVFLINQNAEIYFIWLKQLAPPFFSLFKKIV